MDQKDFWHPEIECNEDIYIVFTGSSMYFVISQFTQVMVK